MDIGIDIGIGIVVGIGTHIGVRIGVSICISESGWMTASVSVLLISVSARCGVSIGNDVCCRYGNRCPKR